MELYAKSRVASHASNPLLPSYSTPNFHHHPSNNASLFLSAKTLSASPFKVSCNRPILSHVPKAKSIEITASPPCSTKESTESCSLDSLLGQADCSPEYKIAWINEYLCQFIDDEEYEEFDEKGGFLSDYFSIRCRAAVVIKWLLMISREPQVMKFVSLNKEVQSRLLNLVDEFSPDDAKEIRRIQGENYYIDDVEAVEDFLIGKFESDPDLVKLFKLFNLSCKPQEINSLAFAFMMNEALKKFILPKMDHLIDGLSGFAKKFGHVPALGNQIAIYVKCLEEIRDGIGSISIYEKSSNTLGKKIRCVWLPTSVWINLEDAAKEFVESLGINQDEFGVTRPDYAKEVTNLIKYSLNCILFGVNILIKEHIYGSSLKAQDISSRKIISRPTDFEYSQANIGAARCGKLMRMFETGNYDQERLHINFSFMRDMGKFLCHSFLAYQNTLNGTKKFEGIDEAASLDTAKFSDSVGHIIKGVMEMYELPADTETHKKLEELRGKWVKRERVEALIEGLEIPSDAKINLSDIILPSINFLALDKNQLALENTADD